MLKIHDLTKTEELDRNAMQAVEGGWTYTGVKSSYYELYARDSDTLIVMSWGLIGNGFGG